MANRGKVIAGLEDSLANNGCGFMDGIGELFAVSGEDLHNAIALLKTQEPRVMALDEAQNEQYVFLETRKWVDGDYRGTAKHKNTEFSDCITEFFDGYGCVLCCDNAMYGDNWRCWTSRPTDEQMEAEPWE